MSFLANSGAFFPSTSGGIAQQTRSQGNTQYLDKDLTIYGLRLRDIDQSLTHVFFDVDNWKEVRLKKNSLPTNTLISSVNLADFFDIISVVGGPGGATTATNVSLTPIVESPTTKAINGANTQLAFNQTSTYLKTLENADLVLTATATTNATNIANNTLKVSTIDKSVLNLDSANFLKIGMYRGITDGVSSMPFVNADEIAMGLKFVTSNAYDNFFYYTQAKFDTIIAPILDSNRNVNFFAEFRGSLGNGTGPAQLSFILSGSYDAKINLFYDHLFTYNANRLALDPNFKPNEVRLVIFHEINNTQIYEWGFNYNKTISSDWNSALINGANGSNTKADYLLAVQRIRDIHNTKCNTQFKKDQAKITINFNYNWSVIEELATFIPPRQNYDYISYDAYDRYQASAGAAFFHANLDFLARKGGNRLYNQIVNLTDAPILICECGSSSNTTKYNRARWFINAVKELRLYQPQVVELTYFSNDTADWTLTANDKIAVKRELSGAVKFRPQFEIPILFKNNITTKDLSNISNWLGAGANAGVRTILTATTPTSPSTDESNKNAPTLRLSMTTSGTDALANQVYFTELGSLLELNTPHTLTFQAYSDVDNINLAVGLIDDADGSNNLVLRGNGFIKLGRKAQTYSVGIVTGLMGTNMRVVFGAGNNTTTGNIYIDTTSIKLERGEYPSTKVPLTTATATVLRPLNTKITSTALTATIVETPLNVINNGSGDDGTNTIIANRLIATNYIFIKMDGVYTTTATTVPTLTVRLKLGTITLLTQVITLLESSTNRAINMEFLLAVRGIGVSGNIDPEGRIEVDGIVAPFLLNASGSVAVNTTISNAIEVSGQLSNATAGNTITIRKLITEIK